MQNETQLFTSNKHTEQDALFSSGGRGKEKNKAGQNSVYTEVYLTTDTDIYISVCIYRHSIYT